MTIPQIRMACIVIGWMFVAFTILAMVATVVTTLWPELIGYRQLAR